jgi:hypothetical protein
VSSNAGSAVWRSQRAALRGALSSTRWAASLATTQHASLLKPRRPCAAGYVPASLGGNQKLVALNMAYNRLGGDLGAFADAVTPPRKASIQQVCVCVCVCSCPR